MDKILTLGVCALSIIGATVAHIGEHAKLEKEGPHAGYPVASDLILYGKVGHTQA
jgi:hypothetical protein